MLATPTIEGLSAVSLVTQDMARSARFYLAIGFSIRSGGKESSFTSVHAGPGSLNLLTRPVRRVSWPGGASW